MIYQISVERGPKGYGLEFTEVYVEADNAEEAERIAVKVAKTKPDEFYWQLFEDENYDWYNAYEIDGAYEEAEKNEMIWTKDDVD